QGGRRHALIVPSASNAYPDRATSADLRSRRPLLRLPSEVEGTAGCLADRCRSPRLRTTLVPVNNERRGTHEMFSYSNPAFIDAEARHRRERLAQDWSPLRGAALDAVVTGRA